jgi:hypothetical protein
MGSARVGSRRSDSRTKNDSCGWSRSALSELSWPAAIADPRGQPKENSASWEPLPTPCCQGASAEASGAANSTARSPSSHRRTSNQRPSVNLHRTSWSSRNAFLDMPYRRRAPHELVRQRRGLLLRVRTLGGRNVQVLVVLVVVMWPEVRPAVLSASLSGQRAAPVP